MSTAEEYQIAKKYVDAQLDAMRSFGAAPKNISSKEYATLVERIASTLKENMGKTRAANR